MENKFGIKLKELRLEKKMSLRGAAELANLSHSYIRDLENGILRDPSSESIEKLAKAYDIPLHDLWRNKLEWVNNQVFLQIDEFQYNLVLHNQIEKFISKVGINSPHTIELSQKLYECVSKNDENFTGDYHNNPLRFFQIFHFCSSPKGFHNELLQIVNDAFKSVNSHYGFWWFGDDTAADLDSILNKGEVSYKGRTLSQEEVKRVQDMLKVLLPE